MKKIIYIIALISIIGLIIYNSFKYPAKHFFWNNHQPIITGRSIKDGVILKNSDLKHLPLSGGLSKKIFNKHNINDFLRFINKHFDDKSIITLSHLNWHMDNAINNNLIFGIEKNGTLYGVIAGNVIYITIDNKKYKTVYVDFLCIDNQHRKSNYSPLLISFIIEYMKKNNCMLSLFKKDTSKHYFKHIYQNNYYLLNIKTHMKWQNFIKSKNTMKSSINTIFTSFIDTSTTDKDTSISIKELRNEINKHNIINDIYSIYENECSKYRIYEYIDIKRFKMKILSENILTLLFYKERVICGYIVLSKLYYSSFNDYIYDIYHFISINNPSYKNQIINMVVEYLYSIGVTRISTSLTPTTTYLIKYLRMTKCTKSYYYLYNYSISDIQPSNILLNY